MYISMAGYTAGVDARFIWIKCRDKQTRVPSVKVRPFGVACQFYRCATGMAVCEFRSATSVDVDPFKVNPGSRTAATAV